MKSGPSRVNAPLEGLRFQGPRGAFTASGKKAMHAPIHPVQNGHAKIGKGVGREGTPGLVLSAYGGEKE